MAANAMDAIMLFGDSLTQGGWEPGGFAQRLAYVYARRLDVINRGLSGYNAEWGIPVFEQVFAKKAQQPYVPQVKLLTIWFGANDAVLDWRAQHSPLPRFVGNLTTIINMVQSPESEWYSPKTRIILITPPPFSPSTRGRLMAARDPPQKLDRDHETTKKYAEAVVNLGKEKGIPVVDIWNILWKEAEWRTEGIDEFLTDGLHVNAEAYGILFHKIMEAISENYPELHYSKLPFVYAAHDTIDERDPRESLRPNRVDI